MREIHCDQITAAVAKLCVEANYFLGADVVQALEGALKRENSPVGREILKQLIENADIARAEQVPLCQDTGFTVVLVELGQDVRIVGGSLVDAINEGVRQGYQEGFLRYSIVGDPLLRKNTGDNTPACIHVEVLPGEVFKLTVMAKGAGCENMSALKMLKPSDGIEGVKGFVMKVIKEGGGNPCPPIIVGVGIGGTFELAAYLSKKALLRRPLGSHHPEPTVASLEEELLRAINESGLGPMGLGGRTTALAVHLETYSCHIASLPVAVNIDCHSHRFKQIWL
ncbi:MAG: fumarate hydratase [candidate division NC10 bacterium]|nr:fumarate hydratase [candidate division NC10 bacterium]